MWSLIIVSMVGTISGNINFICDQSLGVPVVLLTNEYTYLCLDLQIMCGVFEE